MIVSVTTESFRSSVTFTGSREGRPSCTLVGVEGSRYSNPTKGSPPPTLRPLSVEETETQRTRVDDGRNKLDRPQSS